MAGKRPETDQNLNLDVSSQKWDLKDSRLVGSRWKQQNSTEVGGAGPPPPPYQAPYYALIRPLLRVHIRNVFIYFWKRGPGGPDFRPQGPEALPNVLRRSRRTLGGGLRGFQGALNLLLRSFLLLVTPGFCFPFLFLFILGFGGSSKSKAPLIQIRRDSSLVRQHRGGSPSGPQNEE